MEAERTGKAIIVHLSQEEVFAIQAGNVIGDRPGVTIPDAKIQVFPLSAIEPDDSLEDKWVTDRVEKGLKVPIRGRLDTDGDLSVFIPALKLSDVRISSGSIARESIETPGVEGKDRKRLLHHAIPENGVIVKFGGSLRVIDIGPTA